MALQINKTFNNGVVAQEAYVKILDNDYEPVREGGDGPDGLLITIAFYYNQAARNSNLYENILETKEYLLADKSIESRSSQYAYLKSLPEFSGAIDI